MRAPWHNRRPALFGCVLWIAAFSASSRLASATAGETSATLEQRIDEIAERPVYSPQVGWIVPTVPPSAIPFFGFTRNSVQISSKQFLEIRPQRDAAIAILRRAIARTNEKTLFSDPGSPQSNSAPIPSGVFNLGASGLARNGFIYESRLLMLLDLNGSEAMEDLIAAGDRIPPPKSGDARTRFAGEGCGPEVSTLSAILALLYNESDPAVLKSEFADAWRKILKDQQSLPPLGSFERYYNFHNFDVFDPVENRTVPLDKYPCLEWTPERRAAILGWARDFVKRVPVEQRARAKNMSSNPYPR